MVLKMTALGVATTSNAYLSSGWNRLDCFIVTSSLLTIVLGPAVRVRAEYDGRESWGYYRPRGAC